MSKAVLISIRPEWCEKIVSGQKTIEVRKTRPKIETPFKCYIYESHGDKEYYKTFHEKTIGKVIGEFVCDGVLSHCESSNADLAEQQGCIRREKLFEYSQGRELYGWHISDLAIYDKPKDIRQFAIVDKEAVKMCPHRVRVGQSEAVTKHNGWIKGGYGCEKEHAWEVAYEYCDSCRWKPLNRPPQSWCYVEK